MQTRSILASYRSCWWARSREFRAVTSQPPRTTPQRRTHRAFSSLTTFTLRPISRKIDQTASMSRRVPIESQRVDAPLTQAATFLVLTVNPGDEAARTVRSALASVSDLTKNVAFRDLNASFACTVGIGSEAWDRFIGLPKPRELHPFKEMKGAKHTAASSPGDLLFHIRSERRDLNFEFERQLMDQLGDAVAVVDETNGFRYFDVRDLLGFVDGTANPVGPAVVDSIMIAEEDTANMGGSYVVVQKYLHNLEGWKGLKIEDQESVIGRTKLENIELDDAPDGQQQSHKSLATIEQDGQEYDILRDNMPFGSPGSKEYGTYFIGYSRHLWVIEKMLERMFIGEPPGLHDRILDYSTATTGVTFFVPSATTLASLD
ncbi:Dyp-type peroxidase [Polyplosphaeria fusca]|uniref:Dyp-type peroxidase n=1 Tax=Polyplosphaeria fusca TaxID=682080 RepID=A0A9P4UWJ0_9PLEO|nr:Dyp-type peroxidase [Polyplosphaeria fusca]